MRRRKDTPEVSIDDILRADPKAVADLAASNRTAWQCLTGHMRSSEACPEVLRHALLAIDNPEGWRRRIFRAFNGLNPDDGMEADFYFLKWIGAGIELPKT